MDLTKIDALKIGDKNHSVFSDEVYAHHLGGEFEPETCDLIKCFANGECCLDVGANIGMTSLLLSELSEKVYSFEPVPSTYSILIKNLGNNNKKNVTPLNYGLGDKSFTSEVQFAEGNRSGGFITDNTKASDGHVTETIQVERGDTLLKNTRHLQISLK